MEPQRTVVEERGKEVGIEVKIGLAGASLASVRTFIGYLTLHRGRTWEPL